MEEYSVLETSGDVRKNAGECFPKRVNKESFLGSENPADIAETRSDLGVEIIG